MPRGPLDSRANALAQGRPAVTLVDTSVWIEVFRRGSTVRLESIIDLEEVVTCLPVIQEVLQGFRRERDFSRARQALLGLPLLRLDANGHVAAAQLFRMLRRKGVTVRGAVDCIIAQTCIAAEAQLLTQDRDFTFISRHSPLRLAAPG